MPSSLVHSAEVELPKIQTTCKVLPLKFSATPPFPLGDFSGGLDNQHEIWSHLKNKQWDQAWSKLQNTMNNNGSQRKMLLALVEAMFQANEGQSAVQYLNQTFPAQSERSIEGTSAIAAELIKRNQFPEALSLLKPLPTQYNLGLALRPVERAIAASNQLDQIFQVIALFPNQKIDLLASIGRGVAFEPEQAKQVAARIESDAVRSQVLRNMAEHWIVWGKRNPLKGWKIASEIEDCSSRIDLLLLMFWSLQDSDLQVTETQKAKSLDELEALISTAEVSRANRLRDQIDLADVNIQSGRKTRGRELLVQIAASLKSDEPEIRASTMVRLAEKYALLGNASIAVRSLELAVKEIDITFKRGGTAFKRYENLSLEAWRERNLQRVASLYRSLNQPQKAEEIERSIIRPPVYQPAKSAK